ncbi:TetR/AcrR family transcriptional regulator [Solimonas aquatica]|nr:TetR/AcrR family transcriptional regulator [Solimonas aquatica]
MTEKKHAAGSRGQASADTAARLLQAAMAEFAEAGFSGTDSNRIARRAGYAPQTFYRWYADKTAIFIAVYRDWEEQEMQLLTKLVAAQAAPARLAEAIIRHHQTHRRFRHSLRQLTVSDASVAQAREDSRRRQVARIRALYGLPAAQTAPLLIRLLQIERLADAAADGELRALGLSRARLRAAIAQLIAPVQAPGR